MVSAKANVCNVAYMDLLKCGRSEMSSPSFRTFLVKKKGRFVLITSLGNGQPDKI